MIVLFQIIFCALKNFLDVAWFDDNARNDLYTGKEILQPCTRQEDSKKSYEQATQLSECKDSCIASTVNSNDEAIHYRENMPSRNPAMSNEFLKSHLSETSTCNSTSKSETSKLDNILNHEKDTGIYKETEKYVRFEEEIPLHSFEPSYPDSTSCGHPEPEKIPQEQKSVNYCLSDRDWLDELQYLFTTEAKEDLKTVLWKAFSETRDPFNFVLFVMSYAEHDIFSGKNSLTHIMLAEFESWLQKETGEKNEEELQSLGLIPTQEQQDNAFEIVATSKLLFFEPVRRIFKLDCNNNGFLEKHIRYLLHTGKRYKEAATFAYKLKLQTHFEPSEILLPLLILDKLQLAESYVMSCPWQQRAYLSMLDKLCGMNDDKLQEIVDSANIYPKPKDHKLKNKILVKMAERLVKKFHLNGEDFPNVYKEKNLNGLRYLLHKKYTEKNKSSKKWDNLIESAIGNNYWLQERLIEGLVDYGDVDEAVRWANYYELPLDAVPFVVQQAIREWNDAVQAHDVTENWDLNDEDDNPTAADNSTPLEETPQSSLLHQFPLPYEKIIFVDDEWGLSECLSVVSKKGTVLGFDAEWRPTMCRAESNEKLAIIQLATWTEVYVLDMISLMRNVSDEQLQGFAQEVFSNPHVLKLGYGCESDFQVMMTSCPPFKAPLSQVKRFVDICPLSKQVLSLPQIKKKINTIRERRDLKRFEMEKGLSELVMLCVGKPLDKTYQVSDWEGRPLLPEQLTYAALDAYCLLEVYSVLHNWVHESRVHVNMEPELHLSSLESANGKRKSRTSGRSKLPKPGSLGKPLSEPVRSGEPISVRSLSVVVDTMLQGLGRHLRCCGVDVKILSTGTSHEQAAKIASEENRILLTSGTPYYTMRSQVPEGMCMCVPAGTAKEQVAHVLRHYNVRVTAEDIFSRCQICNGNQYITVLPAHMETAYHIMINGTHDSLHLHLPPDCPIDMETLTLKASGVHLKLGLLHEEVWNRKIDLFYCCATCGKIFWEGSHFKKVMTQFAHVLDTEDQRGTTVYTSS